MIGKKKGGEGARRRGCENFREGLGRKGGFGPLMGRLSRDAVSIALNFRSFYLFVENFFLNSSFINTWRIWRFFSLVFIVRSLESYIYIYLYFELVLFYLDLQAVDAGNCDGGREFRKNLFSIINDRMGKSSKIFTGRTVYQQRMKEEGRDSFNGTFIV